MGEENLNDQHAVLGPSNPLLGYGVSGKKSRVPLFAALVVLAIVLITSLAIIWNSKIQLPNGTTLLAMVPGKAQAATQLPEAWRAASPGWIPRIWGVALQQGKPIAFAVVPRWSKSELEGFNSGLFKLISVEKLEAAESAKTSVVFRDWWKLGWHEGRLTLKLEGKTIAGWVDSGAWTTDYRLDETFGVADQGDVALDMEAWPGAWEQTTRALSGANSPLTLSAKPQSMSLFLENGQVVKSIFAFPDFSPAIKQEVQASLGQYASRTMTLPDSELAEELLYPISTSTEAGPISAVIERNELKLEPLSLEKPGDQTLVARITPGLMSEALEQVGFTLEPDCTLRIYRLRQGNMQVSCLR